MNEIVWKIQDDGLQYSKASAARLDGYKGLRSREVSIITVLLRDSRPAVVGYPVSYLLWVV